jgi:tetratricopeptide (TPR) repeat protein
MRLRHYTARRDARSSRCARPVANLIELLVIRRLALVLFAVTAVVFAAVVPTPSAAQTAQFDAWFDDGDIAAAEREIARLLARDADDRSGLIARARAGVMQGDGASLDGAVEAMQRCLARRADDADCHRWLGRAYGRKALEAGMLTGVRYASRIREHFTRAVALAPDAIEPRYDLNQFYILAPSVVGGGKVRARENVDAFAQRRPAEAALLQAQLAMAEERFDDAERLLLGFTPPTGSDAAGVGRVWRDQLSSLGFTYFARKPPRLDAAGRIFEFGAARFPRAELFLRGQGRVAQEQGRYEAAAALFEQALAIRPQPGAHYRLAQVAEKLGDNARAIVHYEKTLRSTQAVPGAVSRDAAERLRVLQKL